MAVYVLVHGGWGGGWEWKEVGRHLSDAGHVVYRPTLTGLGERRHLARPEVDLDTHIADVIGVLECEDLSDVILTGQSYGGMVVTGVGDRSPSRLARVVYIDAFVPRDSESCNDLSPAGFVSRLRDLAEQQGDGWLVPVPFADDELGLPDDLVGWYAPRLVPQPLATLDQPLHLTGNLEGVPRVYIDCRPEDVPEERWVFTPFAERARAEGWYHQHLPVGHDAQVINPEALAHTLLEFS